MFCQYLYLWIQENSGKNHTGAAQSCSYNNDNNEKYCDERGGNEGDEKKHDNDDQPPDFSLSLRNRLWPVLSNLLASEFVIGLVNDQQQ